MKHLLVISILSGLSSSPLMLSGQGYFQQRVDHVLEVRLDDIAHVLHGRGSFTYTNNSPRTLDTIWMHLWPNAYSRPGTALDRQLVRLGNLKLHFAKEEDRGWIDSLDFQSDGRQLRWALHEEHPDIGWIALAEPLRPGASVEITTPFRVKIPNSSFSRLGHTGQAYHITQWYPKPAVFDASGWHAMPYLTQGEFYSNFGTFDVSITVPENYVVGATGMLQDNAHEERWLDSLATLPLPSTTSNSFPPSGTRTKTLRYVQENVHDHGWFADKRFIVRKGNVQLARSGRTVTTWALFTPRNAALWEQMAITSLNESVRLYSEWVGDYPYGACTAVDGTISAGGGMEYPMITIIGNMGSEESLDNVIAHEVGHNWFYGILASNERDHAWMDEGMNSFMELRYMRERHPGGGITIDVPLLKGLTRDVRDGHRFQSEAGYRLNARRNLDQPAQLPSADFTPINYGTMVYMKTALAFDHLFAYLGPERFDRCMHAYFDEWKFRHPAPGDVRAVFERESGEQLGWLFDELIGTSNKVDISARKLRGERFTYHSSADVPMPMPVTAWRDTVKLGTAWIGTAPGKNTTTLPWNDATFLCVDHEQRTLDIDRRNGQVAARGILRRTAIPRLGVLMGLEHHDRGSLYWTPLIARNMHDGWHLGIGLHNYHFPPQRTEWIIAPMYGFNSERLIGGARIEHHFDRTESRIFQNVRLALNARSASILHTASVERMYVKIAPEAEFFFKRDPLVRDWQHSIQLRYLHFYHGSTLDADQDYRSTYGEENGYGEFSYTATSKNKLFPVMIRPVVLGREGMLRGSLEVALGATYNERADQFRLRLFGGYIVKDVGLGPLEAWRLSWGPQDLLYDHAYVHRNGTSGLWSRQFNKQQGAFRTPFRQGVSDSWIGSANLEVDLPLPLPISIFASSGMVPITIRTTDRVRSDVAQYHEAGIGIQLIRDVAEVWFPLWVSQRITDEEDFAGRDVADRIRFVLAFERLDPTRILRKLAP